MKPAMSGPVLALPAVVPSASESFREEAKVRIRKRDPLARSWCRAGCTPVLSQDARPAFYALDVGLSHRPDGFDSRTGYLFAAIRKLQDKKLVKTDKKIVGAAEPSSDRR